MKERLHLFTAIGIELEYMIVDRDTLKVKPICDKLIEKISGEISGDYENGKIAWSNELVTHVVELKTNGPAKSFVGLSDHFYKNIEQINGLLASFNAMLLPTGAHPLMDPHTETSIWPHEYNEIYSLYNKIFDCKGHGWSNLQSMHMNLPFADDGEFAALHTAIRFLMPIMPALTASTPILDGAPTGFIDSRLETYRHNQEKIPSIGGLVIPEAVFSKQEYYEKIFNPIIQDIKPYDTEGILEHHFLNSRGAIARFDRGAIEIRILDLQEASKVDLAIAELIFRALELLSSGEWISIVQQTAFKTEDLSKTFLNVVKTGEQYILLDKNYISAFGLSTTKPVTPINIWEVILSKVETEMQHESIKCIKTILEEGSLSTRILKALNGDYSKEAINGVYEQLAVCLNTNQQFKVAK